MNLDEFLKHVYHTRLNIHIPCLNKKIDKKKFFVKGKYSIEKEQNYLLKIYTENLQKIEKM